MRNVFDQFDQEENRLTHGLATTLSVDRQVLKEFVSWLTAGQFVPNRATQVIQQSIPGINAVEVPNGERKGLPDICVYDGDRCLAIEVKAAAKLSADQLRRHQRTLRRHFDAVQVAAITADSIDPSRFGGIHHRTWQEVYEWLGAVHRRHHFWCSQLREFLRILESQWIPQEYGMRTPLTTFDGIPFGPDSPYSYREAKLLIKQVMPLLKTRPTCRRLGVDPAFTGRPAITGRDGDAVWDLLSLRPPGSQDNFTSWPHLTMGIRRTMTDVMVTIPNSIRPSCRAALRDLGEDGFFDVCREVLKLYRGHFGKIKSAKPMVVVVQRHFLGQRKAVMDGNLRVDLRTAFGESRSNVKCQKTWMSTAYQLATNREGANLQMQFGVWFDYSADTLRDGASALAAIEGAWSSCEPVLSAIMGKHSRR